MAKGYTKFDNDYFQHLSQFELNGSEFRTLLFILRQSACYKRSYTKKCSYTFIAEGTGLSESSVKRAISGLIKKGFISIGDVASGKSSYSYELKVVKLGFLGGQVWTSKVVKVDHDRNTKLTTKEIKENNSIENKEKEKASPIKFINDLSVEKAREVMDGMTEEERAKFLEGSIGVQI